VTSLAVAAAIAVTVGVSPAFAGDSSGMNWGADGNAPVPNASSSCGSSGVPWLEPNVSSNGCGKFGVDYGEIGGFFSMSQVPNCNQSPAWSGTAIGDAYANAQASSAYGVGAGGYFLLGGPGISPGYNGSIDQAYGWGESQGNEAVSLWLGHPDVDADDLPLALDVEEDGGQGWNELYENCSNKTSATIAENVDRATLNGAIAAIQADGIQVMIYAADGNWPTIFGSGTSADVSQYQEWTAHWGSNCANYAPPEWTQTYLNCSGSNDAVFFGDVVRTSSCAVMWQWSGGTDDYDQIDKNRIDDCS
jgi:hypothetical protein